MFLFVTARASFRYTLLMKHRSFDDVDISLMFQFVTATALLRYKGLTKG